MNAPQHTVANSGKTKRRPGQPETFRRRDSRINRRGRPRGFDQFRALAQAIAHEKTTDSHGNTLTVAEAILRSWAKSKEPTLQKAFVEFAFGKVPEKLETTGLENKTTLILHYDHERQERGPALSE
jgi:hypothetical protein